MAIEVISAIATWSECYKNAKKLTPKGIVLHSTGANNPNLKRYVNSPARLGKNAYSNFWGTGRLSFQQKAGIPHAAIGYNKIKKVIAAQVLPYSIRCWGCGSGKNGSYNSSHIQIEMCEDDLTSLDYLEEVTDVAAELCAMLMKKYPAIKVENIVSHREAAIKGYASAHGDPENWLSKFGYDMDWFRAKVKKKLGKKTLYRVQTGAFSKKENAQAMAEKLKSLGFSAVVTKDEE